MTARLDQQVTFCYNRSLQRNDASLMKYGFIQRLSPPRLCGVDLPGGTLGETLEGPAWEHVEGAASHAWWPHAARSPALIAPGRVCWLALPEAWIEPALTHAMLQAGAWARGRRWSGCRVSWQVSLPRLSGMQRCWRVSAAEVVCSAVSLPAEEQCTLMHACNAGNATLTRWQRLFVEFRMVRKEALHATIDSMAEYVL